ncbi:hypothetical protein R5W23_001446 [Gemmata sp. JC673]|uniref:DUF4175 family protein n=1 Tax=Gemmata algarum TaxID=2975278 RepID=A0ABU5EYJ0_9BACT|nr:hypothetical protein [Gemmata algarum]MDY3560221.1 hypothetical protein [Gemmata algarum]
MALLLRPPTDRESLADRLAELGRTRKRVAVASGVFAFVAVAVGGAAGAGVLDAAAHLSPAARAFALVAVLVAAGAVWVRGPGRARRLRTDALAVSLELEDRFPALNDSLASAVSFLGTAAGDEPPPERPGVSNRLTSVAVRAAERRVGRLPLEHLVPYGPCWRNGWLCAAALAVAFPLALFNLDAAGVAAVRLADPFGAHPWPTKTRIELLSPGEFPARIAKGEAFELRFAVRGALNGPATVSVRVRDGGEFEEQFPLAMNNDPKVAGAAVVTVRFDPARVPNTFELRVTANDGATEWQTVDVVPPPRLVPLDGRPSPHLVLTPPAYAGLAPLDIDGVERLEVPTGTLVRFRAAADVRLSAAVLTFVGDRGSVAPAVPFAHLGHLDPLAAVAAQALADEVTADIPLTVSGDGALISATFTPRLSGLYALRLTDDTGLTGTRTLKIDLTPDPVPKVTLSRPVAGRDPQYLAPTAAVRLAAVAEDPLYGARRLFLEYRVGRDGSVRTIPLATAAQVPAEALAGVAGGPAAVSVPPAGAVEAVTRVPVSAFTRADGSPVREGDLLVLRAAADDFDDVAPLKGLGRSATEVEIRIASPEAIDAWLQKELAALRPDLVRIREQQRDARQKVAEVTPLPGGVLSPLDRDRLVGAEQGQRQVAGRVIDPAQGLRARADLLRETVRANGLPRSNTTDRVAVAAEELGRTADRDLGAAQQNLADAIRTLGQPPAPEQDKELADYLKRAGRSQRSIEDTVSALLDLLALWGGAGEIRGEARVQKDNVLRQLNALEQLKERVREGKLNPTDDEKRELDRAGVRADQAAEQAGQLIARAARLAAEKDGQAAGLRSQAALKDEEAGALKRQAGAASSPVEKSALSAQADAASAAAADLRAAADKAGTEARALRTGLDAAGGQQLPDTLRGAAERLRRNRQNDGADALRDAGEGLGALADALAEKEGDAAPELAKPQAQRRAADQLDALAGAQDRLRKRVEAANTTQDPVQRAETLKVLGLEQDKLLERGRELLQKLTAEKADAAARDTRNALDKMEAARDDLERGQPNARDQRAAVEQLDAGRDRLDRAAAQGGQQLSDEKRRKLADQVKSLAERQKAAVAEALRVHGEVAKQKGWDRPLLTSYSDIDTAREAELAAEARKLGGNEFAPLPVLARLLTDAAGAMDRAREKIKARCDDADLAAAYDAELEALGDRNVMRPMELALRRLEQLADALKPDDKKEPAKSGAAPQPPPAKGPPPPNAAGGGDQEVVPPLAQLKVLRALQAELNERTARFAADHPDPEKLTPAARDELKELEQAQREVADLFEQVAKMFGSKEKAKGDEDAPKEAAKEAPGGVPPQGKP